MATLDISSLAMQKHYRDKFEELYNKTILESPRAKFFLEELTDGKGLPAPQHERHWKSLTGRVPHARMASPIPKSVESGHKRLMSPAAKIIQQMKKADAREKGRAAATDGQETCTPNRQSKPSESSQEKSLEKSKTKEVQHEEIPSFHCSDSDTSGSSMSNVSLEQQPEEPQSKGTMQKGSKLPTVNAGGKPNLHRVVQMHKSPQKQKGSNAFVDTAVHLTRSKSRTSKGEDVQIPADLPRSLTPDLKAAGVEDLTKRSPSPKTRNSLYRNKKVDINESVISQDPKTDGQVIERSSIQLPDEVSSHDNEPPDPGVDKDVETGEREVMLEVSTQASNKGKKKQETDVAETPSTRTTAGLQQGSIDQDDETPKNSKISKTKTSNETVLDDWFMQFVPNNRGVRLQGHRVQDPPQSFWNSSVITQRVNQTTVTTKSGSVYKLVGKIEKAMARAEGFTVKVIKQFQNGFPINWKEILSEFMHKDSLSIKKDLTAETPVVKTSKKKMQKQQTSKKQATPKDTAPPKTPGPYTPENTVTIKELPRSSRSGRMIKPPLAYWVNQRVRHNLSTDTIEIIAGGTNYLPVSTAKNLTGSTELSQEELARKKKLKQRKDERLKHAIARTRKPNLSNCESTDTDEVCEISTNEDETDSPQPTAKESDDVQQNVRHSKRRRTKSREQNAVDTEASTSEVTSPNETQGNKNTEPYKKNKRKGKQHKNYQVKLDDDIEQRDTGNASDENHCKDPPYPKNACSKRSMNDLKEGDTVSDSDKDHHKNHPAPSRETRSKRIMKDMQEDGIDSSSNEDHDMETSVSPRKTRSKRSLKGINTKSALDEERHKNVPARLRTTRSKRRVEDAQQSFTEITSDEDHCKNLPVPSRKTRSGRSMENIGQGDTKGTSNADHHKNISAPSRKTRSRRSMEDMGQGDTESTSDEDRHKIAAAPSRKTRSRSSMEVVGQSDTESTSDVDHHKNIPAPSRKIRSNKRYEDIEQGSSEDASDGDHCKDLSAPLSRKTIAKHTQDIELSDTESARDENHHRNPPSPPKKTRSKTRSNDSGLPQSPLYYNLSPDISSESNRNRGTLYKELPVIGRTPSLLHQAVAGQNQKNEKHDQDTPRTAGLKVDAVKHGETAAIPLSDIKKKIGIQKTLGSSPLNLQQEVMSVIQTYKHRRTTKMQERRATFEKLRKNSLSQQKNTDSSDVYDLENSSDDFEEEPRLSRKRTGSYLKSDSDINDYAKVNQKTLSTRHPPAKPLPYPVDENNSEDNFTEIAVCSKTSTNQFPDPSTSSSVKSSAVATSEPKHATKHKGKRERPGKTVQANTKESTRKTIQARETSQANVKRSAVETAQTNVKKSTRRSTRLRNKTSSGESKLSEVILISDQDEDSLSEEPTFHLFAKRTKVDNTKAVQKLPKRIAAQTVKDSTETETESEMVSLKSRVQSHPPRNRSYPQQVKSKSVDDKAPVLKPMQRILTNMSKKEESVATAQDTEDVEEIIVPEVNRGERKNVNNAVLNNNVSRRSKAKPGPNKKGLKPSKNTGKPRKDLGGTRKNSVTPNAGKNDASHADGGENDWSSEELAKLKSAIEAVSPGAHMYWQCVASLVESKSAALCQLKHQESLEKLASRTATTRRKSNEKKEEKKDPVKLTAKVGTMKRKRQLRELVEQHNQGHEEDYFDSTPFKRKHKRLKQNKAPTPVDSSDMPSLVLYHTQISANLDSDDEEEEGGLPLRTPGSARFKTPSVRPRAVAPLSDMKTPHTNLLSPWPGSAVNRNHIDTYISGIQKKKKVRTLVPQSTPSIKKKIEKAKKATDIELAASKASAAGLFDVRPASDASDSEEDKDYYWSEEEGDDQQ